MIHGPKETKARWSQPVITLYRLQNQRGNQRVLRSLFPRPDVSTVLLFAVFLHVGCTAARWSGCRSGTAKKSSHPWHFRCWSPSRNDLECTNLVHWTEALHRFSSRDAIIVVGSALEKHFDGDFTQNQEKEITFKRWPPGYQSWKLCLALNGLSVYDDLICTTPRLCQNNKTPVALRGRGTTSAHNCFPATGLYFKSKVFASVGRGSTETTRLQHGSSMFGDTHAKGGGGI